MTGSKSSADGIETHIIRRYEIQKRLGKGVSTMNQLRGWLIQYQIGIFHVQDNVTSDKFKNLNSNSSCLTTVNILKILVHWLCQWSTNIAKNTQIVYLILLFTLSYKFNGKSLKLFITQRLVPDHRIWPKHRFSGSGSDPSLNFRLVTGPIFKHYTYL